MENSKKSQPETVSRNQVFNDCAVPPGTALEPSPLPGDTPMPVLATVAKRYFVLDDDYASYYVVATDLNHARSLIRDSGAEFGDPSAPLDQAEARGDVWWKEIGVEAAGKMQGRTEDERGTILLADANIGEWFCSEY